MNLRILLPPTLSGCVQRNAIPAKIEIEQIGGSRTPPEKIEPEKFAQLEEAERCALFALSQWCGGNVSSFMQLDQNQMGELLRILNGVDCFYLANDPGKKLLWKEGGLVGVSELSLIHI